MTSDELIQATYDARDAFYRSLGKPDDDVLAPVVNPVFMGGPEWPALREAWRVVRRPDSILIVSDGLSDPFEDDDGQNAGLEIEVVAETCDSIPDQVESSWLFDLVYEVSQQCAEHGGIGELIEEHKLLSLELPGSDALRPMMTPDNSIGVLLGVESPSIPIHFSHPAGPVRVITAKLLCPAELDFVAENGRTGREELASRFKASGENHLSSLNRQSVV